MTIVKYLGVEISDNNAKCLVLCVYNLDRSNCLDAVSISENITLCGDLNVDSNLDNSRSKDLPY